MRTMKPGFLQRKKSQEVPKIQFLDSQGKEVVYADPAAPKLHLDLKTTTSLLSNVKGYSTIASKNSQLILAKPGTLSLQNFVEKRKTDNL